MHRKILAQYSLLERIKEVMRIRYGDFIMAESESGTV